MTLNGASGTVAEAMATDEIRGRTIAPATRRATGGSPSAAPPSASLSAFSALSADAALSSDALRNPKQAVEEARLDETGRRALQSRTARALWDVLLKREPQPIEPAAPLAAEIREGLEGRRGSLAVVGNRHSHRRPYDHRGAGVDPHR
jgi:hypothetical protein